jgi:signal transduction histidine kinase
MAARTLLELTVSRDRTAGTAVRRALDDMPLPGGDDTRQTAQLLATELVNNAVLHGRGRNVRVEITRARDGRLRVEVGDSGRGFDPAMRIERDDPGGWGLALVDTLAARWGMSDGRTNVWFELAV